VPTDLQQLNKRSVHRAMEVMGVRAAVRAGSELQAPATHQESVKAVIENALASVKQAGGPESPE
jgi:enoyl-CoA hydratase